MDQKPPHSGQGITGTALGALGMLILLTIFAVILIADYNKRLTDSLKSLMGVFLLVDVAILIVGAGLSVKGIMNKERSKLFGIIGLLLNLPLLIFILGMIMGYLIRKLL